MVNRTFVEVAGVKPRGGRSAICGRRAGGGFTRLALAAAMAVVLFPFAAGAQDAGRKSLHGHVPPALARFHLQPTGHLAATNQLHLAIGLPLRNQAALDKREATRATNDPAQPCCWQRAWGAGLLP